MTETNQNLSAKYQMKTDKQHILDNPGMYIGSTQNTECDMWILSKTETETETETENERNFINKKITFIPALLKLFDECIINSRDHVVRMLQMISLPSCHQVTHIEVSIDETGMITIMNDGNGIDIAKHEEHNMWIPEMIFAHLRSSTNYDTNEKKITGGLNGLGIKLVFIWSLYGKLETVDHTRGLKYTQEFKNNLDEKCVPIITKTKVKPYTKIMFRPDYKRFGINELSEDMLSLFKKRVYDIGAVTNKVVKVKYNGLNIPIRNFKSYIEMYIPDKSKIIYEEVNDRWEYGVSLCLNNEFSQISFVNGINTYNGGKHVEYILNQITKKLVEYIEKKKKIKVNTSSLKEQLILFINCSIENPSFNSQNKDCLTTNVSNFGSTCVVSDKIIEKIAKMGIMETACALTNIKEENKIAKKTDGVKSRSVRGIPKLIDANWAGTEKSDKCMLILCEGDSAKAGVVSGLTSSDKDYIGIYPLKGKLLNVRGENNSKIAENKEIIDIKKILGLENGKNYETINDINKHLRYSKILIICDQDVDGSHIKGLIINLFHNSWCSLLNIPGFISFMNTPILKAKKNNQELLFYNEGEYNKWKTETNTNNWIIKYYKGLGTSTGKEFKEYFQNKKIVGFEYVEGSDDVIDMVFNKKRANNRKEWLSSYDRTNFLDTSEELISYKDFINKELIHFSKYDCDRSIPNLIDGFKTSQRKILYSAFKRNLTSEIKVAQFSGYVSEHSNYHHGEASLNGAIIGMAQNFIGSNNINLLVPNGQFGSRICGGSDHASERYIFTLLNKITKNIFNPLDNNILDYLNDDGTIVEPIYYIPIVPMILVNGAKGIGTGFSTEILCYNLLDIINYLKNKLNNQENSIIFNPYYEGFTGLIQSIDENNKKYIFKGVYQIIDNDTIRVTELPLGFWINDFKVLLESLCDTSGKDGKKIIPLIKDFCDNCTDTIIDITITFQKNKLKELLTTKCDYDCNGLEKLLKLYNTNAITNMHLFDANDKLKKYDNVESIIDDYYDVRLEMYEKRKSYIIFNLEKELLILNNKVKYIQEILDSTIDLRRKKNSEIFKVLEEKNYNKINDDYNYLIKMPMDSVNDENVNKLNNEYLKKSSELENIKNTTIYQMWLNELEMLEIEYNNYVLERNTNNLKNNQIKQNIKKKIIKKKDNKTEDSLENINEKCQNNVKISNNVISFNKDEINENKINENKINENKIKENKIIKKTINQKSKDKLVILNIEDEIKENKIKENKIKENKIKENKIIKKNINQKSKDKLLILNIEDETKKKKIVKKIEDCLENENSLEKINKDLIKKKKKVKKTEDCLEK
jgi:DNA topoisomerase-2